MFTGLKLEQAFRAGIAGVLFAAVAVGQSSNPFLIEAIPVGRGPQGVAVAVTETIRVWAAVANSGEDSVSLFEFSFASGLSRGVLSSVVRGIPAPYSVTGCLDGFLVTSPSANSVSLIRPATGAGTLVATARVGPQPYSASCLVVSNYGDNSISVLDFNPSTNSLTVTKTIPNVPGGRGLHGLHQDGWVAGTDADVVTLVDLAASRVVVRIPVRRPTAVGDWNNDSIFIASSADNAIYLVNRRTLQTSRIIPNVPTPQDVQPGWMFASTGSGNSVAWIVGESVILIPGIPGAAGLAAYFGPPPRFPPQFALVTSPDSNSVFLIQNRPAVPRQFSMANAASFAGSALAPGSLASLFATTGVSRNFLADSLPLPRTLGGVTLRVGGSLSLNATSGWAYSAAGALEAALLFVGPNQINFQVPPGTALGDSTPAQLVRPDGGTLLTTFGIVESSPGIFTLLMNGQGQAAVLNQDNSLNFGTNPAARGTAIQIFATGAGATNPPLLAGEPAPASGSPLVFTQVQPTVTIGGRPARVLFSGLAPGLVGVWQINAEIPAEVVPGPAVLLTVTAGGVASNTVTIAVQ